MTDGHTDEAIRRWAEQAIPDAERVSEEDWRRRRAGWLPFTREVGDWVAGLSDGELVRLVSDTRQPWEADAFELPWPVRGEIMKLSHLARAEVRRRALDAWQGFDDWRRAE